jgi:hypothetical protein
MSHYTTVQIPKSIPLTALVAFARSQHLLVQLSKTGQIILVDSNLKSNVQSIGGAK